MNRAAYRKYLAVLGMLLFLPVTGHSVGSRAITVHVQPDLRTGAVLLRLANISGKDISAFNVSLIASYSNGKRETTERMVDRLPRIISKAEMDGNDDPASVEGGLRPGETTEETTSFVPVLADGSRLTSVGAEVDVVVFSNNTASVQNDAAFARILDFRKSSAAALDDAVKVINRHLATEGSPAEVAAAAASEIREVLLPKAKENPASVLGMQLSLIAEDLERFAAQKGTPRSPDLSAYASRRQKRARRMDASARVERAQ